MGRGKAWTAKMDAILVKYYADEESTKLAREFGYGLRTIERHAAKLGLKKSDALLYRIAKKGSDAATAWIKRKKERGEKIEKKWGGHGFEKGHKWDEETEARRIEGIRNAERKKNLDFWEPMSKFALKGMSNAELERLLKDGMERIFAIRQELDRRKSGSVECEKAKSVNFEEYVAD